MARIIDGNKIAEEIYAELEAETRCLKGEGIVPGLGVVLVGEDPASRVYVGRKASACQRVGIYEETVHLPLDVSEEEVLQVIDKLNEDEKFHGVLVQLPLPKHISEVKITQQISPEKDVDALHPLNMGRLVCGDPYLLPCTPHGILQLLTRSGYSFDGMHIVICGRSNIVGKPLAAMLTQRGMETNVVTMCDTMTRNLASITRQADILVVAVGSPGFIIADMVKSEAVVVDVGTNRQEDPTAKNGHRLIGDVSFEDIKDRVEAITPVPGGVGPMTVAMLSYNVIKAARTYANTQ
jgi:methylenetetrahydrofolate dehydrogenase (NADP+) / methenyltetrahydrofolate cyclohydrolase